MTSAVAAPAAVGVPVTQRGVNHAFTVVSGHLAPDDPRALVDWDALGRLGGTIVVVMGVRQARRIAEALLRTLPADTPAAIIQDGETANQRDFRTTLGSLADTMERENVSNPATYVIGEVAGLAHAG